MTAPLRVGLVGCGRAAERLYLPALAHMPDLRVVAVCDPSQVRRELIAERAACASYGSSEEMLGAANLQAALILTTPETHIAEATRALRKGLPVLIEKPLAVSLREAEAFYDAIGGWGGRVMLGFNRRFWEPVVRLRGLLEERHREQPWSFNLVQISDAKGWGAVRGVADPLDDLASHQVDLLRFLTGREVATLSARRRGRWRVELEIELSGSPRHTAVCLVAQDESSWESIRVCCGDRRYEVRAGSRFLMPPGPLRSALDLADAVSRRLLGRRSSFAMSFERELSRFAAAIRDGATFDPRAEDGLAAVRAVDAARRSSYHAGRPVAIVRS